jgi:DNA-directed RNA polymerase specialized sigma24 family protein
MTASTDRDLIVRARRGDYSAFGELVTCYQSSVFNVCYRLLHERGEAEDLAQETFMRVYDRLDSFDIDRDFGPWIRRVAANLCLNYLESQKITAPFDEERDADESQRPEKQVEVTERSEGLAANACRFEYGIMKTVCWDRVLYPSWIRWRDWTL